MDTATSGRKEDAAPLLSSQATAGNSGYSSIVAIDKTVEVSDAGSGSESDFEEHGTTPTEAFLNLLKGYFGAGMLRYVRALAGKVASYFYIFFVSYL